MNSRAFFGQENFFESGTPIGLLRSKTTVALRKNNFPEYSQGTHMSKNTRKSKKRILQKIYLLDLYSNKSKFKKKQ